jgi:hypothetical protein
MRCRNGSRSTSTRLHELHSTGLAPALRPAQHARMRWFSPSHRRWCTRVWVSHQRLAAARFSLASAWRCCTARSRRRPHRQRGQPGTPARSAPAPLAHRHQVAALAIIGHHQHDRQRQQVSFSVPGATREQRRRVVAETDGATEQSVLPGVGPRPRSGRRSDRRTQRLREAGRPGRAGDAESGVRGVAPPHPPRATRGSVVARRNPLPVHRRSVPARGRRRGRRRSADHRRCARAGR